MLIIPIENKLDWKHRPPLITVALILINCLIFFFYQSNDPQRIDTAQSYYRANLFDLEARLARDYLATHPKIREQLYFDEAENLNVAQLTDFAIYFRAFDLTVAQQNPTGEWQRSRTRFEELRDSVSSFRYGLTPAEPFSIKQITALFMHANFGHLLGNMIFLFLFGFGLEAAIGRLSYFITYLISGLGANFLYILFNNDSYIPLIGASGAISGLMGMYLAVYGLRKIQFFYTVVFYADRIKAPALIVLPIFILKELYGVFFEETNIAYWAHIGGLVTGFGLIASLKKSHITIDWDYVEKKDDDDPLQEEIERINDAVVALDFPRAKALCQQSLNLYPQAVAIWKKWFDLCKLTPKDKEFHTTAFTLLKQVQLTDQHPELLDLMDTIVVDYIKACVTAKIKTPALSEAICLHLLPRFLRQRRLDTAELLAQQLLNQQSTHKNLSPLLQSLVNLLLKSNNKHRASNWASIIKQLPAA